MNNPAYPDEGYCLLCKTINKTINRNRISVHGISKIKVGNYLESYGYL